MQAELEAFEAMVDRLGRARRLGQIDVLDQVVDDSTGAVVSTTVRFVNSMTVGVPSGSRRSCCPGT